MTRHGSSVAGILGALALLACACGGPGSASPRPDGGPLRDAGLGDELSCTGSDVLCGSVCQPESVSACGPSCTVCPQPALSHGMSDCVQNKCVFECVGGYAQCGAGACCGGQGVGDVAELAVGGETTCGVTVAGALFCWGSGAYGALADGVIADQSSSPVAVAGKSAGVVLVRLGDHHGCALLTDRTLQCWGDDEQGQLGDGQRQPRPTPSEPVGLGSVVTGVATGGSHTCAVTTAGSLFCWGDNTSGQLGVAGASSVVQPAAVAGLGGAVKQVAAGEAFTCALLDGGQVQCWGDGNNGQLGSAGSSDKPLVVAMPAPITAIAAGAQHACAITAAGGVFCWGAGDRNQLGSASGSTQPMPVAVPMITGAVAISAGGNETCAIDGVGAVYCWGADPLGDVGLGPGGPGVVPSLTGGMAGVSVVGGHACAVTARGAPKCWGTNNSGDLGDGTMVQSWVPIDVPGI